MCLGLECSCLLNIALVDKILMKFFSSSAYTGHVKLVYALYPAQI